MEAAAAMVTQPWRRCHGNSIVHIRAKNSSELSKDRQLVNISAQRHQAKAAGFRAPPRCVGGAVGSWELVGSRFLIPPQRSCQGRLELSVSSEIKEGGGLIAPAQPAGQTNALALIFAVRYIRCVKKFSVSKRAQSTSCRAQTTYFE